MGVLQSSQTIAGDDVLVSRMTGLSDQDIFDALTSAAQSPTAKSYAVGDGVTLDTDSLKLAVKQLFGPAKPTLYLNLGNDHDAVFLVDETIIDSNEMAVIVVGNGTIKRADNWILNTDASPDFFEPIIRIKGAPFVHFGGNWKIDGNRDGQTYPENAERVGRGQLPWRHNGDVEICPSEDNSTPSRNIKIDNGGFANQYLNGLVLWQCENVVVSKGTYEETTWNGISGAGCDGVYIGTTCCFLRCGASDAYDANQEQGDRAGIQFREFPKGIDNASEGIPCLLTGRFENGGINTRVVVAGNTYHECGVESVYLRACFQSYVINPTSTDVGYKRLDAPERYRPAHIWCENGEVTILGGQITQNKVNTGDQVPDALRVTSLVGDARAFFPAHGEYFCRIINVSCTSAKDIETGESLGLLNYGLRTNGHCTANITVDGTLSYSIWLQNDDSFPGDTLPSHFCADGSTLFNCDLGGNGLLSAIRVSRFGSTTGNVKSISAVNVKLNQDIEVLSFNPNLSEFEKLDIAYGKGSVFSRYSESQAATPTPSLKLQSDHNLSTIPKTHEAVLTCLSNDGGWQTGDELRQTDLVMTGANQGMSVGVDSTKSTLIIGSSSNPLKSLSRASGSEGNTFDLNLSKWQVSVRCYA